MSKGKEIAPLDSAIAAVLEQGQGEFDALVTRLAPRFYRREARERAKRYLGGLFAPVQRRNAWQLAEHLGGLNLRARVSYYIIRGELL